MVSNLTSRLLGSHRIRSGKSADNQSAKANMQNDSGSGSGYSTDRRSSSSAPSPPILIDLQHKQKRDPSNAEDTSKRRKLELTFTATSARADLARAGRAYPKIMTVRSRIAPSIDISQVQLVCAKSKEESSPFLHSTSSAWSHARYDILTDFGSAYRDILSQSRAAYAYQPSGVVTPNRSKSPLSETTSASSLSDIESDDSHCSSSIVVVHARLDDSLGVEESTGRLEQRATKFIACPPSMAMRMEEAVGVCDASR